MRRTFPPLPLPKRRWTLSCTCTPIPAIWSFCKRRRQACRTKSRSIGGRREPSLRSVSSGEKVLTEIESKAILSAYGIPVNHTVVASARSRSQAAKAVGFPVVVKVHSPDITHKSDVDGVRVHLNTEAEVLAAFEEITWRARRRARGQALRGYGAKPGDQRRPGTDPWQQTRPDFGPLILFGMGGVLTEVFKDTAVDLPPLNLLLARRLMERTRFIGCSRVFAIFPLPTWIWWRSFWSGSPSW